MLIVVSTRMLLWILLSVCCLAAAQQRGSSSSGEYGKSDGKRFSFSGNQLDGPITGFRIRSNYFYITGIQFKFGKAWSQYQGGNLGDLNEHLLFPGEHIVQVSGKYTSNIRKLVFKTNKDRTFSYGSETGTQFTAAPLFPNTVLRYISGTSRIYLDSVSFHWDYPTSNCQHCN